MLLRRPHFARPTIGVEITFWWPIKRRELGIFATVVIFHVMEALLEVFMTLAWIVSISLKDNMSEKSGKFSSANIISSETK